MTNHFFKNHGPFNIEKLLELSNINNINNYQKKTVTDIKDLVNANNN